MKFPKLMHRWNRQADHQTSMVEIEGMIQNKPISILIDRGASLRYV